MAETPRKLAPWPFIIVGMLALQMVCILAMVRLAGADPAFGVEPDYYEKAVKWDAGANARTAAQQLGWNSDLTVGQTQGPRAERELRITLHTSAGTTIDNATIRVECFPHARSAGRQQLTLSPQGPGVYTASLSVSRPGLWEFRLEVIDAGTVALFSHTVEIPETTQ